jgi:hypothetical protein
MRTNKINKLLELVEMRMKENRITDADENAQAVASQKIGSL